MQTPETLGQQTYQGQNMRITYTKAEALEIMRNHIADLMDVEVTEITVCNYTTLGEDYLNVTCTKVEKVTAPRRWIKDPSYQDHNPEPLEKSHATVSTHYE